MGDGNQNASQADLPGSLQRFSRKIDGRGSRWLPYYVDVLPGDALGQARAEYLEHTLLRGETPRKVRSRIGKLPGTLALARRANPGDKPLRVALVYGAHPLELNDIDPQAYGLHGATF